MSSIKFVKSWRGMGWERFSGIPRLLLLLWDISHLVEEEETKDDSLFDEVSRPNAVALKRTRRSRFFLLGRERECSLRMSRLSASALIQHWCLWQCEQPVPCLQPKEEYRNQHPFSHEDMEFSSHEPIEQPDENGVRSDPLDCIDGKWIRSGLKKIKMFNQEFVNRTFCLPPISTNYYPP